VRNNASTVWPYTFEGAHLSCLGHAFVAQQILIPFFEERMAFKPPPAAEMEDENVKNMEIRMFSLDAYPRLVMAWSSWADSVTLRELVVPSPGWTNTFMSNSGRHGEGSGHGCYGSTTEGSAGLLRFRAPAECKPFCEMQASFVFSWNRSYVGDLDCHLFAMKSNRTLILGEGGQSKRVAALKVIGNEVNGINVTDSTNRMTPFGKVRGGLYYIMRCVKPDNRFTCITGISLFRERETKVSQ
jgi:hypothetical protein